MGSKVGKILKTLAPAALSYFAPGIGTAVGSSLLGAGAAGASTLGSALVGGGLGALTGGGKLSNILTGAVGGGLGANLGDISKGIGLTGPDSFLGEAASNMQGPTISGAPLGSGSGFLGSLTNTAGGGASSFGGGNMLSNVLSAGLGTSANDDAEKALLEAQGKALGAITPFQNTSFTPTDLQNDPGYQFQLQQGEQALARNQAARGNYFSGEALKAAQDYGQGLAGTTFDAANNRYNTNRNFNYGVATDQAGIFGNQGNIEATAGVNNSNVLSGALSGILGGTGINNTGQKMGQTIKGYDPKTGQPIYG